MPSLLATLAMPWQAGAGLLGALLGAPWQSGAQLLSTGGAYSPGAPPSGGTPITPGVGGALYRIRPQAVYLSAPAWEVRDARDDTVLNLSKVTITADADSSFWTVRAEGLSAALYAQLLAGEQPARVRFTAQGQTWEFLVDTLARTRDMGGVVTSFVGRSLGALAAEPFQAKQNWTNEAATVASQICASALRDTGVQLDWRVDDWAVPAGVFSLNATPLQVVKACADAVGAIVRSHPSLAIVEVLSRYPSMPNEWRTGGVDVDLALDAVFSESLERVESAEYDGVYLSGQQGGIIGFVRLEGTAGAKTHPYLSEQLLCDIPALQQRGRALIGASTGGLARVPMSLPVLYGAGEPGVLELNQLVRVQDPAGVWYGLMRSVSASFEHGRSQQQVSLERHLRLWKGSVADEVEIIALKFVPSIADQTVPAGVPFSLDISSNWTGGVNPRTYSIRAGSLPTGLGLDADTGVISGTPTAGPPHAVTVRCVDAEGGMADSNEFTITPVTAGLPTTYGPIRFEDFLAGTGAPTIGPANYGSLTGPTIQTNSKFAGLTEDDLVFPAVIDGTPDNPLVLATTDLGLVCEIYDDVGRPVGERHALVGASTGVGSNCGPVAMLFSTEVISVTASVGHLAAAGSVSMRAYSATGALLDSDTSGGIGFQTVNVAGSGIRGVLFSLTARNVETAGYGIDDVYFTVPPPP